MLEGRPFDIVLFDLGGVLIELVGGHRLDELTQGRYRHGSWGTIPIVQEFESGRVDAALFADTVMKTLDIRMSREEFLDDFRTWPRRLFPGAVELVEAVRAHHRVGCFTNCNSVNWPRQRNSLGLAHLFDVFLLSYELGCVKPHPLVYERALEKLSVDPGAILFLDDSPENVEAAVRCGIRGVHASGIDAVVDVLRREGVLGDET